MSREILDSTSYLSVSGCIHLEGGIPLGSVVDLLFPVYGKHHTMDEVDHKPRYSHCLKPDVDLNAHLHILLMCSSYGRKKSG